MIQIDRTRSVPIHEQLVEQLRFLIASGHYRVSHPLPSTRKLAEHVGVSFHTVRKAYQQLEQEGLLESRAGSGFLVAERAPLDKSERMERGAVIVHDALHRLVGLGLKDDELEYLFQEQLDMLAGTAQGPKVIFVAPYQEMALACAEQLSHGLQLPVEPAALDDLDRHLDADVAVCRYADVPTLLHHLPRADVVGVVTYLSPEALAEVARMHPDQTLGLVTRYPSAIAALMAEIRHWTGFAGQTVATTVDDGVRHLDQVLAQTDLLVYTPPCRRQLAPHLKQVKRHVQISPVVDREALERLHALTPV